MSNTTCIVATCTKKLGKIFVTVKKGTTIREMFKQLGLNEFHTEKGIKYRRCAYSDIFHFGREILMSHIDWDSPIIKDTNVRCHNSFKVSEPSETSIHLRSLTFRGD